MNKSNKGIIKNKGFSLKKSNKQNNINLPIIEKSKKNQVKANNKYINNIQNPENSTISLFSQSSIKSKSISNITSEERIKPKNTTQKINDIIINVNKSHNINSPIINKEKDPEIENLIISKEKEKGEMNINNNNTNNANNKNIANNKFNNISIKNYNSKPKYKFYSPKNMNVKIGLDSSPKIKEEKIVPRITKEKLKEIQEKRKKRLLEEKKEYETQKKMLEELKENKNLTKNSESIFTHKINSPIEMSHKKAQHILEEGGMIEAYKYLIAHLIKNGLPHGNLYEYSSGIIKNYEKEWKKKKSKLLNEKINKHFENKKKLFLNKEKNINKSNDNLAYKVFKRREQEQFIKKLDKSRSTLHIIKKIPEIPEPINLINIKKDKQINKKKENKNKENENQDNIINNNNKNIIADNNELKKDFKDINNLNNIKPIRYIKQNYDEKKVYFNIKIKNNIEEINEKDENKIEINPNNTNYTNNRKKVIENDNESKKEEIEEINSKKKKKGIRFSIAPLKRGNLKLNDSNQDINSVKTTRNMKEEIKNFNEIININESNNKEKDNVNKNFKSIENSGNKKNDKNNKKKSKGFKNE